MYKTAKEESEQSLASVALDAYRIDHPRQAPPEACSIRLVWGGGEEMFEDYCANYNRLVKSLKECVDNNAMSPQEAKEILEECRRF